MRIGDIRRSGVAVAAAVALAAVCACTVQTPGAGSGSGTGAGGDGGGHRGPVHIEIPTTSPPGDRASTDDRPGGATPGTARGAGTTPGTAPGSTPGRAPSAPAPVLWSRGDSGSGVRELQARLRQVAWLFDGPTGTYDDLTEQAVKGFQGKRGLPTTGRTDTVTWQRLLAMTHEPGKWELYLMGGQPAGAPDPRCLTGRVLCIDKTSRTLRWMVGGRTLSTVSVRFGTQYTPTREGVFTVYWKSRHHVSTLYHSPMPYAMFFSGGQAVHYSYDFAARGYAGGSHGCVNVRDEAAIAQLFAQVRVGDKVVVHW
ncbi:MULTISPECIES: L,D-transpeptidase family protein [Streptomyces]|uniref:L,D-transpeptidase family protein n=1 Tax=Streptomyces TaxID=1883 RepID=UPI0004C0CA42|nr:L,D-transpeptidase family protein [Streptomyces sp. NRRL S-813]